MILRNQSSHRRPRPPSASSDQIDQKTYRLGLAPSSCSALKDCVMIYRCFATTRLKPVRPGLIAEMTAISVMHLGGRRTSWDVTAPGFSPGRHAGRRLRVRRGPPRSLPTLGWRAISSALRPLCRAPAEKSAQFGSVLFSQAALILLDGIFLSLSTGKNDLND